MNDITYQSLARKKRIKQIFIIIALLVSAFTFWKLSNTAANQSTKHSANHSNTLTISGPWELTSLAPSKKGYILTRMQVIETLLNVDSKGELTPGLAKSWQMSEGGKSWHFTLRENVKFHDGSVLNAKAVILSLQHAQQQHSTLKRVDIEAIEQLSEYQFKVQLKSAYLAFGALLANYSTAIISNNSYDEAGTISTLYGTGAYQVESFSPPHQLIVKRNDQYWGNKGSILFANYLTGHRAESRILQAKSGEADIVYTIDPAMLSQLRQSDNLTVHSDIIPRTLLIKLNSTHPFLDSAQTRRALSLALNRALISKEILHAQGSQTSQLLPESMGSWHLKNSPTTQIDLTKAQHLLAQSGWKKHADGLLYKNDKPFKLNLITYADRPELTSVATALQAQWAALGIDLKVTITNSSMIPAGHKDGTLQVALLARNFGSIADPYPIISKDFVNGGGDWGTMNWYNKKANQAIKALAATANVQRQNTLKQQFATAIEQDLPVIPLANYSQHTAVNNRVQHFKFDPFERDYFINQMELK